MKIKIPPVSFRYIQEADIDAACRLLRRSNLPTEGVTSGKIIMLVAEQEKQIIGCGGIEPLGRFGVLRSLSVCREKRGSGYGSLLLDHLLSAAALHRVQELFLLTKNGRNFFAGMGFSFIAQESIPLTIQQSDLWKTSCCSSAICMKLDISGQAHYFPQTILQLKDDLPGVQLWAVCLEKTMLTYFTVEANSSFPEHRHESEQITMVLSGKLYFSMQGTTRKVANGEVIAIPAHLPHAVYTLDHAAVAVDAWSPIMKKYQ